MARIVIFTDGPDWHSRRLTAAFDRKGAAVLVRSLRDCIFHVGDGGSGISIPGLEGELPDAVLVKTVAGGSFEQVTLRLGFLHALAALGVPVVNCARAIERCVDKSMTSFLLHRAGIPTPVTVVGERDQTISRLVGDRPSEWVAKPLFGSQGRGLLRLRSNEPLPPSELYAGVRYIQRFVGRNEGWRDFRIMVVGRSPVAAMIRHGKGWITNVGRGARCEPATITNSMAELSLAAVGVVGAEYAGIDMIEHSDGALYVLEVNSMPAWKGLQGVASCDIAQILADHVLGFVS
ncbi:MAG TPA: RimK family alpha-L-glutamate ligase [Alphaproteobacteria bacterium]|nr:RimK family alpha-L-glutamate ligase [Alphaproteobacteria bacterium]